MDCRRDRRPPAQQGARPHRWHSPRRSPTSSTWDHLTHPRVALWPRSHSVGRMSRSTPQRCLKVWTRSGVGLMGDHEVFGALRPLLFTIAYEILGTAADAEDVLQDSYLRWRDADQEQMTDARAYLMQIVTRQSLNHLRTVQRRRENYIGNWLPEPICTEPDASTDAILAESVSMAMLLVLETLNSTERAVFVLSEVFGYSLVEIGR